MNENTQIAVAETPPDSATLTATDGDESKGTYFQVHQFVDALYEPTDILEFRILPSAQSRWTFASTVDDVLSWLIDMNAEGQSIYVGCNPRSCEGDGSKAKHCTGFGRFAPAWPLPSKSPPLRCDMHSPNLSQVPQKPQSS